MTRIRQWVLAAFVAAMLSLSFSSVASADPKDGGFAQFERTSDPKDGGFSY